jgi:hypothetical protein
MKFCWHCWHSKRSTYRAVVRKVRCQRRKEEISHFEWEEECCICGKTKTKYSVYNYMLKDLDKIPKVYE